jgi:MoaA/NifB/PqqE/SkfB family radical SAM enzyme
MYPYESIRQVHLELTDKCNATCPQCPRSDSGGPVSPGLALTELSLDDIKTILLPDFVVQLDKLYACGNYGDPIVARDCLPIFQYFRECNTGMKLGIHTNGGARSVDFWQGLGRLLPKGKGYVRFGIDGLEDTNHVYRRNVRWHILMRNIKAFVAAGGNAEWDYLVFRHNEHQVELANKLADDLGFTLFNIKKTGRFLNSKKMEYKDSTPIKNRDGDVVGRLERPVNPAYQNQALGGLRDLQGRYGSMDRYLDQAEIQCKVQALKSIYVSAEGYVLPCCWLAGQLHNHHKVRTPAEILGLLEALGGTNHIDGKRRGLRAIVEGDFFQRLVPGSWSKPSCPEGKLRTCAGVCGHEFKQYEAQSPLNRSPGAAVSTSPS